MLSNDLKSCVFIIMLVHFTDTFIIVCVILDDSAVKLQLYMYMY